MAKYLYLSDRGNITFLGKCETFNKRENDGQKSFSVKFNKSEASFPHSVVFMALEKPIKPEHYEDAIEPFRKGDVVAGRNGVGSHWTLDIYQYFNFSNTHKCRAGNWRYCEKWDSEKHL